VLPYSFYNLILLLNFKKNKEMETKLKPINAEQLQEWIDKLKQVEATYEVVQQDGQDYLVFDAAYTSLIMGQKEYAKRKKILKVALILVGLFVLICIGAAVASFALGKEDVQELSPKEQLKAEYESKFGLQGDWVWDYSIKVKENYAPYGGFRVKEAMVLPIDQDSLTHVLVFDANNAFGTRRERSITTVISKDGDLLRVVTVQ
jgi:hypothetical protein